MVGSLRLRRERFQGATGIESLEPDGATPLSNEQSAPITTAEPNDAIREWFRRTGRYCASVDYQSARSIFAEDVVAFGTNTDIVSGLDPLQRDQWEGIWPNIDGFLFDEDGIRSGGDQQRAWGVATWRSTGFDERGAPFDRPGRATVVLERREHTWLAVHTHFSLFPGTPQRTYGSK